MAKANTLILLDMSSHAKMAPDTCIAIDPKGELATITASRRSPVGSKWSKPMEGPMGSSGKTHRLLERQTP
jgi:hypothetical protein